MKLLQTAPQVRHLVAPNRYELNATFMRLQEFYESPNPKFRGKAFTHEQYMDWYAYSQDKPQDYDTARFSYFEDWSGFNVPGDVVCKFFQSDAFWLDMWKKERKLWELLAPTVSRHGESFYLIGTFAEDSGDTSRKDVEEIVAHETAHALWYLSPGYRKTSKERISQMDEGIVHQIYKKLNDIGYAKEVFADELQAYLSTDTYDGVNDWFDGYTEIPRNIHGGFVSTYKHHWAKWKTQKHQLRSVT